jgi:hypothetical protein
VCPELSRIALCPAARAGISSFPVFSFYVKRTMSGSAPRRIAAAQKARGGEDTGREKEIDCLVDLEACCEVCGRLSCLPVVKSSRP